MADNAADWTPEAVNAARDAQALDASVQLRSNLIQNTDSDPVKAAAAVSIAKTQGLPTRTVENDLPTFQKQEDWTPENVNALRDNTPILADFLAQPDNVRVAHPDIPVLTKIEKTLADVPRAFDAGDERKRLTELRAKQVEGLGLTAAEQAEAQGLSDKIAAQAQTKEVPADVVMKAVDNAFPAGGHPLVNFFGKMAAFNAVDNMANAQRGSGGEVSNAIESLAEFAPTGAAAGKEEAVGTFIGGAVGALAGGGTPADLLTIPGGAYAGAKTAGANFWFRQSAGQVYDDLLRWQGPNGEKVDNQTALYAARGAGAVAAAASMIPLHTLIKTIPGFAGAEQATVDKATGFFTEKAIRAALQKPGMALTLAKIGRNYGENVAATGATSALFTAANTYSEEIAKHLTSPEYAGLPADEQVGALWHSFTGGAELGALTGLPGSVLSAGDMVASRNAQPHPADVAKYFKDGTALVKKSELQKLSPEIFKDFAGSVTAGADVYMPLEQATRLYSKVPPEDRPAFDAAMPDFQQKLAESAISGADVKVSQADYFTHMADHAPADMADHLKFDPSHISQSEYDDNALMHQMLAEGHQGSEPDEVLHRHLTDQFENTGFTPDVARKYADLATARYRTMMERYGDNDKAAAAVQALADQLMITRELPEFMTRASKSDAMDVLISRARSLKQQTPEARYPLLAWLKSRGGINPASREAGDLRAADITNKTMPGLFAKKGGLGLDNIPHSELAQRFPHAVGESVSGAGDNGYVNTAWLMEAIRNEHGLGVTLDGEASASQESQFIDELHKLGIDIEADSNAKIKKAIADYLKNQPEQERLFQTEPGNKDLVRGYIQFEGDAAARMTLTANRNLTTTIHELAHWFAFTQRKLAQVDDRAAADWEALKKHLGAEGQDSLTVAQEEQFAKMFEAYVAEGRAPSVELQDAFQSFKAWVVRAYRRLMPRGGTAADALGVGMNAEVRDFMDRMLATDDQIEQLKNQPAFGINEDVLKILTKADQERYLKLKQRRDETAGDKLLAKALRQSSQKATEVYREERGKALKESQAAVWFSPLYRAANFLRTGEFYPGDTEAAPAPFKLSRRKAREILGKELADRLPDAYYGRFGVAPDHAAEVFGYGTGQEFLLALLNAEPAKAVIERMTNDTMQQRHGDMLGDGTLEREAIEQMHNEYRAKMLEMEGRAAAEKAQVPFPAGTNFKAAARQIIGARNVVDAGNSNRYYIAGKKAAREFGKAIAKGDFFKAAAEKQKEMLNHFLYREALAAKADVDRALKDWRRLRKPDAKLTGTAKGRMDVNFLYLARGILGKYGVMAFRQDINGFMDNLKTLDPQAWEDVRVAFEDNTADAKPWKDLSLAEFRGLRDAVDNIVSVGKGQNEVTVEGKKISRDEVLGRIEESLAGMKTSGLPSGLQEALTELQKVKKGFYSFRALFIRMEAWAKVMDGGHTGLWHDVLINPIFDAKDRYTARRDEALADIYAIIGPREEALLDSGRISAPEIGYVFRNKAELLGMLLHTGNDSNYEKLWRGRKWDPAQLHDMLQRMEQDGTITKLDRDTVQALWDVAEKLKPDAWRAFREMYGHYPEEVTATPVESAHGSYRGGYWPAIVDKTINEDAAIKQDRESIVASNATGLFPSTTLGPTKSRTKYAGPLSFDLNLLPNHIDKMLRITYLQPAVRDVAKIVMSPRFREAMTPVDPGIARTAIVPYLWRAVNQVSEIESDSGVPGLKAINRWANALRRSAAAQTLMYNIPNAVQQLTGIFPSMKRTGAGAMAEQISLFAQDPRGFVDTIHEKSPFMKSRMSIIGQETRRGVDDILKGKSEFKKANEAMNRQGYVFYRITQGFADHVTWAAAYDNAVAGSIPGEKGEKMAEADAVRYADRIVRETQGSSEPESIATYEAGAAWQKLFTMFSGYWNSQFNLVGSDLALLGKDYAGRGGSKELFMLYLMTIALPGILSRVIYDGLKGQMPAPDDKKKMGLWLAGAQLNQISGMVPFVGSEINALWNKYAEHKVAFNDSIFSSPALSATSKIGAAPGEIYDAARGQGDPGKALQDSMYALGLVAGVVPGSPAYGAGVPLGQLGKPAGYLLDLATGHARPKGVLPLVQGMIIGPGKATTK